MASATWHYSWWKKDMYDWALAGLVQICTWWNFKMSRRVVPFSSSQKCHKFMYDARYMTFFFHGWLPMTFYHFENVMYQRIFCCVLVFRIFLVYLDLLCKGSPHHLVSFRRCSFIYKAGWKSVLRSRQVHSWTHELEDKNVAWNIGMDAFSYI
jgi:hypothetical protein